MRHFIVLGFETNSNSAPGEQVHIGSDRGKAIEVTNDPAGGFARKELYELAVPHLARHFAAGVRATDPDIEAEGDVGLHSISPAALTLANEHGLTPEQRAEIAPSGASGNIVKSDVEAYLGTLTNPDTEDSNDDEPTDDDEADQVEPESDDDPDDEEDDEA